MYSILDGYEDIITAQSGENTHGFPWKSIP